MAILNVSLVFKYTVGESILEKMKASMKASMKAITQQNQVEINTNSSIDKPQK